MKKIMSILLAVCLLVVAFPMSAMAEGDAATVVTAFNSFYPNTSTTNSVATNGLAQPGRGSVTFYEGGETTAVDTVTTRFYTNHGSGDPKGWIWLTVNSSNPNVATATAVSEGQNLKVTFEAKNPGTTTITIGYTISELSMKSGIAQDSDTAYYVFGDIYYTVTVGNGGGTDPSDKPEPPSYDVIADAYDDTYGAVRVQCRGNSSHTVGKVSTIREGSYTTGEVLPYTNDPDNTGSDVFSYKCIVDIDEQYYCDLYNKSFPALGVHGLSPAEQDVTIPFYYTSGGYYGQQYLSAGWYSFAESVPVYVYVTCKDLTEYTLIYDDNCDEDISVPETVKRTTSDASYTFSIDTTPLARENYRFLGWSTDPNATEATYLAGAANQTVTAQKAAPAVTLYAVWLSTEARYIVRYTDGVDGEEVFADQVYSGLLSGTATPAFEGTPAREGYVFAGWNPAVSATVTGDATYTATWKEDNNNNGKPDDEEDKYTVRYTDGVDGEEVFADQVYSGLLSGTATPAFEGTPAREGYVFAGWNPAVSATVTGDETYTATWTAESDGKPQTPSIDEVKDLLENNAVQVVCIDGTHEAKLYGLLDNGYTIGEITGDETNGYTLNITIVSETYIEQYNQDVGETHSAANTRNSGPAIVLVYENEAWTVQDDSIPVVLNTQCETSDDEQFTVVYTDGVEDEEIFEDQTYYVSNDGSADTPAFEGVPEREGYEFSGWSPEVAEKVTESVVYTAQWEKIGDDTSDDITVDGTDTTDSDTTEESDNTTGTTDDTSASVPADSDKKPDDGKAPQTSDNTFLYVVGLMLSLGLVGFAACLFRKKQMR